MRRGILGSGPGRRELNAAPPVTSGRDQPEESVMIQQSLNLRDNFDYQPELIARLVNVYDITLRSR